MVMLRKLSLEFLAYERGSMTTVNRRRSNQRVMGMGSNATGKMGVNVSPQKRSPPLRGADARYRAREILRPYSKKTLAEWTDATPETTKCWKAARCLPNFENSASLSRELPEWWEFVCQQAGHQPIERHANVQSQQAIAVLEQLALTEGRDGASARRMLVKIHEASK